MRTLIVIPARGGSKGIPNKNIKLLGGRPLIQYTLEAALTLFEKSQILVSTDSIEIKTVVENLGVKVPFLRPQNLSNDTASTYDVLIHALKFYERNNPPPEVVVLLQPTSPFRKPNHILEALDSYHHGIDMVVSVKPTKSNPYYVLFEEDKEGWLEKSKTGTFDRRQDCPEVWEYNGAVYVMNTLSLKKSSHLEFKRVKKYVMEEKYSIDLDTLRDWSIAECMLKEVL